MFRNIGLAVLGLSLFASTAFSFEVSMSREDIVVGKSNQMNVKLVNNDTNPIALEVSVAKRKYTKDGTEILDDTNEDILVLPSQIILGPNESQFVALRWVGEADIKTEIPYRLMVENIPIDITSANVKQPVLSGQIKMTYRLVRGFYVRPEGPISSMVTILNATSMIKKSNDKTVAPQHSLQLNIVNKGDLHQIARSVTLSVSVYDDATAKNPLQTVTINYTTNDLDGGINFLPKEERTVVLPWPKALVKPRENQVVRASIVKLSEE
jgi:fimbrial chaperone protein